MTRAEAVGLHADGYGEDLAVAIVEPLGDLAGQLEVLALVVAHGDLLRRVEQDVARHQHRIGQEPDAVSLLARAFSLNWVMRESSP